jgi:UDP-N-acetylglucosamine transferase subunit ALG13
MIEELIEKLHPEHEFIAQLGNTRYSSKHIKCLDFVAENDFKEYISKADIVITHAGSGALFSSIQKGKKIIAVARLQRYHEMTNDHQTELVKKLTEDGYILDGTYSIVDAWKKLDGFTPRECDFKCSLPQEIGKIIDNWLKE